MAAHSAARRGISTASDNATSSPTSIPNDSAIAGHTSRHENTSPLVMLNVSLRAAAERVAHSSASARRSASTASLKPVAPPGNASGSPRSRRIAPYTPMAGIKFIGLANDSP